MRAAPSVTFYKTFLDNITVSEKRLMLSYGIYKYVPVVVNTKLQAILNQWLFLYKRHQGTDRRHQSAIYNG